MTMKIENSIFIIGVPRSGTSLLYRLLAQHTDLTWFSVEDEKKFLTPEFIKNPSELTRVRKIVNRTQKNFSIKRKTSGVHIPAELSFVYDHIFPGEWNVKVFQQDLEILISAIFELFKLNGKNRYLNKVPNNSIRIQKINEVFPNSKFIHIVRDPRAVVNSMLDKAQQKGLVYFGIPLKSKMEFKDAVENHSLQWKQVVEEIIKTSKKLDTNQFFQIKYEELFEKPDYWLEKITNFCELPSFNYIYNKDGKACNLKNKDPNEWCYSNHPTINNRNKTFPNDLLIEKLTQPLIQELGYN